MMTELRNEQALPKAKEHPLEKKLRLIDTGSLEFRQKANLYYNSYSKIVRILEGKDSMNLKRAVWLSEQPVCHNITYIQFCKWIAEAVKTIKYIVKAEGLNIQNQDHVHYALRKLYNDTLQLTDVKTKLSSVFYPFKYDFLDPLGAKDKFNYTVSKLLKKHTGQCHSLPLLYMILAQELHVNAYMSYTPLHSFIQYYDQQGVLNNFETTNGYLATRDYYMASGFIKVEAIRSGIYLKTVTPKQVLAALLIDLGNYYQQELGYSDFLIDCSRQCLRYFPSYISAQLLYENTFTAYTMFVAKGYGYPRKDAINKYPKLSEMLTELSKIQKLTDDAGYEAISQKVYNDWLNPKK